MLSDSENHHHGHSYTRANANHFDKKASEYEDIPGAPELMTRVGAALRETGVFKKDKTTVLDFACGVGMLSREIFTSAKVVVGVDVSKGSVDLYNRNATALGALPDQMYAIALDIIKDGTSALGGVKFDIVVCSMAYHHFEHPSEITRALAALLNPDGKLFIIDFTHSHPLHKMDLLTEIDTVVPHRQGFKEQDMRAMFNNAGLSGFRFADVCRVHAPMPKEMVEKFTDEERTIDVFLTEGKRTS